VNCGDLFRKLVEHGGHHRWHPLVKPARSSPPPAAAWIKIPANVSESTISQTSLTLRTRSTPKPSPPLGRGEQNTALLLLRQAAQAGIGEAALLLAGRLEERARRRKSLLGTGAPLPTAIHVRPGASSTTRRAGSH